MLGRVGGVRIERRSGPPSARASGRDWRRQVRGPCEKARSARDERARLAGSGYDPRLATVRRANDPPAAPRGSPGADERRAREPASAAALSGRRRREPRPLAATTRSASAAGNMSEAAAGTNLIVASHGERGPVGRTRRCGRRGGVIDPRPSRTHCVGSRPGVGIPPIDPALDVHQPSDGSAGQRRLQTHPLALQYSSSRLRLLHRRAEYVHLRSIRSLIEKILCRAGPV